MPGKLALIGLIILIFSCGAIERDDDIDRGSSTDVGTGNTNTGTDSKDTGTGSIDTGDLCNK